MKSSYWLCASIALAYCVIAWLIASLLSDHVYYADDTIGGEDNAAFEQFNNDLLDDIAEEFSGVDVDNAFINGLEEKYDVVIVPRDSDADIDSLELATEIENSGELIGQEYDLYDLNVGGEYPYSVAIPYNSQSFFSSSEWLHLLLQSIAVLAAVFTTIQISNNRLKVLDGATRDLGVLGVQENSADPVEKAVFALNKAKKSITKLTEAQKSSAADHRDLLASVAHEFRNPLARLQFANEMAMERTGEEQNALFEEANVAAVELDELVRETLRYSRISSLDIALSMSHVSVEDVFRDIANTAPSATEGVALRVQYPEQDYPIYADQRLLTRALGNLVGNALRYANSAVTLSVIQQRDSYLFRVEDDGDGIAAIHHEKLFEPFYRVERSRSRDTGGFGLGLSIVKSICDRHNATVSVESDQNGTCFLIDFPMTGSEV